MYRFRRVWATVFVLFVTFVPLALSQADIPKIISYQGKVTDSGGAPVPDGSYVMRFQIYDVSSGGSPLWDSGARLVSVTGGIFNVLLGQSPQDSIDLDFDQDYWLQVSVAGDVQTPRTPLGSVGYAYMASGLVPGTEISGAITTDPWSILKVTNTATSGTNYSGWFENASQYGTGVLGYTTATSGSNYGVQGSTASNSGIGVYGYAGSTSGNTYGGWFRSDSPTGTAVYGFTYPTSGSAYGVHGESKSESGVGVYGEATTGTGAAYGVRGKVYSTNGYGGYFEGRGYFSDNTGIGSTQPTAKLTIGNVGVDDTFGNGAIYISSGNKYLDFDNGLVMRGTGNGWATRFTSTDAMLANGEILGIYKEEITPGSTAITDVSQGAVAVFNNDGSVGIGTDDNLPPGLSIKTTNPPGWGYTGLLFQAVDNSTAYIGLQLNANNDFTIRTYNTNWYNNLILEHTTGHFGFGNGMSDPQHLIHLDGGAYSDGSSWVDASLKAHRTEIRGLTIKQARDALLNLDPVVYKHIRDASDELHVGFNAEDVPELVATRDREGLSAMEIVAVLTRVVQDQEERLKRQDAENATLKARISRLEELLQPE